MMTASSSSSNSPCAACKFLRRKCLPECVFAPYFPPDQPHKFANVHKVFGASNVAKLLNDIQPHQREDAVNSLAYEADMRLRDPVYGCVGVISLLQHQLHQLQIDLSFAKSELFKYHSLGIPNPTATSSGTSLQHQHQNLGISFLDGASGVHDQFYHHHQPPPPVIHMSGGLSNNTYDPINNNVSVPSVGQSSKFQNPRAVAGDVRRMRFEPS